MDSISLITVICSFLIRLVINFEIDLIRYNRKSLNSAVYQSLQARSLLQCGGLCTHDPSCNSGDYNVVIKECRFSILIGPSMVANMITDQNRIVFGKIGNYFFLRIVRFISFLLW